MTENLRTINLRPKKLDISTFKLVMLPYEGHVIFSISVRSLLLCAFRKYKGMKIIMKALRIYVIVSPLYQEKQTMEHAILPYSVHRYFFYQYYICLVNK